MTTSTSNSGLLRPAITLFVIFTIITGICYPLAVTGIAMVCFPHQADGSLIVKDGKPIGSELIGQEFAASSDPKYLWGRLSATSPVPYTSFNADKLTGSSGSNLGPTNPALIANVQSRLDALKAADTAAGYTRPAGQLVPADLVTSSASGLDPQISPAAADYQIPRIAKARNLPEAAVRDIVARNTRQRQLGFLGEPVVDVLQTNLALDTAR